MNYLKEKLSAYRGEVTYESLKEFILRLDINEINYHDFVPTPLEEGDYGRNILTLEPFEAVLINWPPGVESAVHHHKGLFGYVLVLEGELDNVLYREEGDKLVEYSIDKYVQNGLMPEPDGVIHKIGNRNKDKRAITLHFYYPALVTLENLRLFNLESGDVGVLSKDAETASWNEKKGHFKSIERKTFTYVSFQELNKDKSHVISNVMPKPSIDRINEMNSQYFCEQADKYDFSDFNHPNRKLYTTRIDELIGEDLSNITHVKKHLDIATGTGRRALNIKGISGLDYEIIGVDISKEMCKIASERGIKTYHQEWSNDDTNINETFDVITFLYAFGHLGDESVRVKTLQKIYNHLNKGGYFFFDLFSINNENEWGPLALRAFQNNQLGNYGYEQGDVFYKKMDCESIAFLHYFDLEEIKSLLGKTGFSVVDVKMVGYAKNPGEIVTSDKQGSYFIKAQKV